MHECPTCGLSHGDNDAALSEPAPVIEADPGPNENDVKIAEIEAAARIETEKIWTEQQEIALQAQNDELRGELKGIRETLDRLAPPEPEPAPEPVVMPVPEPEPEPAAAPPPEPAPKSEPERRKGFF